MKYGLFVRGRLLRLTRSLRDVMESRAYNPWDRAVEVYEFTYSSAKVPIEARLIK